MIAISAMPKKAAKIKRSRINPAKEVITRDKLIPFFEDIKGLIVSTAKGTEAVLRKEIRCEVGKVRDELHLTQRALKATKDELESKIETAKVELRAEIKETETRLRSEINETETSLRSEIKETETSLRSEIKGTETSLRSEIKNTEARLSEKIDTIHVRIDDHDNRITVLETPHS